MAITTLQIGRLVLGQPPSPVVEAMGNPVTNLGGAIVPQTRSPSSIQLDLATYTGTISTAIGQMVRRRLRSMLNNDEYKLQGFIYVQYADDLELNGWYVPDPTTISSIDSTSFLAGLWKTNQTNFWLVGRRRTHKEAREVWMKDLRTGLYERDTLGWVVSTDFSTMTGLQVTALPSGAANPIDTVSNKGFLTYTMPAGRDGGSAVLVVGAQDMSVVSFERSESSFGLSDVIVWDRRGAGDAPATGPGSTWEEVYGPDYPWNWLTTGQPADCPVLENGYVRVRFDSSNTAGFRVEVWNGTAYVEQGKINIFREGDTNNTDNTWVSAGLYSYTPDRAVMQCVMTSSLDSYSRERVFITLKRGMVGLIVEVYPALNSVQAQGDAQVLWTPTTGDTNDTVFKLDGTGTPPPLASGKVASTAGTGSSLFTPAYTTLGATSFSGSENDVVLLRSVGGVAAVGAYQTNLAVVQASAQVDYAAVNYAYGSSANTVFLGPPSGANAGYVQVQVGFASTVAQQVMEAENMTLGTNTSSTADAAASNGSAATATRTTDANAHVTQANWPNGQLGDYRVFVRARVSAGTATIYATVGGSYSTTTTTSTSYVWIDLGQVTVSASNATFAVHAWISSGSGTVYVDRVEAYLAFDRSRAGAIYSGASDLGQAALNDSRTMGALTVR